MPLETWWILLAPLALTWFLPRIVNGFFAPVETFFSRLASRRALCLILVFLATIVVRLALLPVLPVEPPRAQDEFSYLLQGDMFAHGRLSYPSHPMAAYLETFYVSFHPTYSSIYPPAQAATLAIGFLLGHPWIGVLLGTAAMLSSLLWMLQGWFPPRWALLGTVLVLAHVAIFSYWMNSYWGGSVAATGAALVLGALPRIRRWQRTRDALLLGLGVGILANSRTFEGFLFCLPVAAALLLWFFRLHHGGKKLPVRRVILPLAACLLSAFAFALYHNWRVTGSPLSFPRAVYYQQYLTVSPFIWGHIDPPHQYANRQFNEFFDVWFRRQYDRTWSSLKQLEATHFKDFWDFYLGPLLSLPFITLPWLLRDRRMRFFQFQFLFCAFGLASVTWFFPHYAAPLFCTLTVFIVQAMRHLRRWSFRGRPVGVGWTRVLTVLVLCQIPACAVRAARQPQTACCHDTPHNWARAEMVRRLQSTPGQHLVIVRYGLVHNIHAEWVANDADIDASRIVWAREISGLDLAPLLAYYHDRKVWVVEPDETPPLLYPYAPSQN